MEPYAAAVPPAPVRAPSQRPLAPSVASVTPVANDKGGFNGFLHGILTSVSTCGSSLTNLPCQLDTVRKLLERLVMEYTIFSSRIV